MDGQKVAIDSIGGAAGFMALALVGVYFAIISHRHAFTLVCALCGCYHQSPSQSNTRHRASDAPTRFPSRRRNYNRDSLCFITTHRLGSAHTHHTHHTNPTSETLNTPIERLQPLNLANQDLLSRGTDSSPAEPIDETEDPSRSATSAAERSY